MSIQFYDKKGRFLAGTRNPNLYFSVPKEFETVIVSERQVVRKDHRTYSLHYSRTAFHIDEKDKELYVNYEEALIRQLVQIRDAYYQNETENIEEHSKKRVYRSLSRNNNVGSK